MAGWFELSKSKDDQFHFVLKAGNAETILTSELYKTRSSAENGIASVRKNAAADANFHRAVAKNGEFYFTLVAGNGQVIGKSEMYKAEASRENGVQSVMRNAPDAKLVDKTSE